MYGEFLHINQGLIIQKEKNVQRIRKYSSHKKEYKSLINITNKSQPHL